ncbi:MAG: GGDEF domain-containing protein [Planctomycetota bacterium]|nr:GGDEF domain-containing protein [Planctomycetota bacterium]
MHDRDTRKILLVGDVSKAFLEADSITEERCEICPNISDAIRAAATNDFAAISVVMFGISPRLSSTLKALRDACDTRIVLMAQMYEEPIAIQLVDSRHNGATLANDYLICPVRPDSLYESIMATRSRSTAKTEPCAAIDATTEMRIRHLERLATEDDLTGLKNRRYIWEFSRQIIERTAKEDGRMTLLLFDIDNFKHYNDLYGHYAGDEILRQAATLMKRCCRAHDVVGRIGGDEFAVVFWDDPQRESTAAPAPGAERRSASADHPKQAIFIAKRLVRELEAAELSTSGDLGPKGKGVLTISGGLASFPRDGGTIQELFEQADKALLEAKRSGKNRIYLVGKPQTNATDINKTPPKP